MSMVTIDNKESSINVDIVSRAIFDGELKSEVAMARFHANLLLFASAGTYLDYWQPELFCSKILVIVVCTLRLVHLGVSVWLLYIWEGSEEQIFYLLLRFFCYILWNYFISLFFFIAITYRILLVFCLRRSNWVWKKCENSSGSSGGSSCGGQSLERPKNLHFVLHTSHQFASYLLPAPKRA